MQAATGQPDPRTIDRQLSEAVEAFADRFGRPPRFAAAAPGRVNLIGEHTDYNDGYVLPMAIDRWTVILADRSSHRQSTLWAIDLDELIAVDLTAPLSPVAGSFANYLLGVVDQFTARGHSVPNLDLAVTSTIPMGAGLASSAAIEVAMATVLEQMTGVQIDRLEKALLCRKAEHTFPGTPCGIMDMFIATLAQPNHALLIDCQSKTAEPISLPPADQITVLIADTNVRHALASSAYAARRFTCRQAAAKLGVNSLREADLGMLATAQLSEHQRHCARHVICESQRVLLAAAALKTNDLDALGELMFDSHASLRDLYEVSCPELDTLVDAASELRAQGGVIGARMTGGGFGGCAVVVCRTGAVEKVSHRLQRQFAKRFGRPPMIFSSTPAGPAHLLRI
ncbi:MAG: galactokinase [Planctomycetes bacterium]|nr:galactokinase [Planctomycetota bacterium]